MACITIETEDVTEARALLDAIETRSATATTHGVSQATTNERSDEADGADTNTDSIGMTWNADIHTSTKAKNADGTWKARKGQADAAKAAAAAFKAGGGNVEPPADTQVTSGGMPGAGAAGGMPGAGAAGGMPGAGVRSEDMDPPITQARLEDKIIGMLTRGTLGQDPTAAVGAAAANSYQGLLDKHQIDRNDPGAVLATNETLRAAVYASCCAIEPEAPGAA